MKSIATSKNFENVRVALVGTKALFLAIVLAGISAVVLVFFVLDPARVPVFPTCMFHQLTGLDCPGCGAQRALHQLLHGNLIAALRLNALFVLSLPLFAWLCVRFVLRTLKNEPADLPLKWMWLYLAAGIVFGILRNLPLPVFAWFAA